MVKKVLMAVLTPGVFPSAIASRFFAPLPTLARRWSFLQHNRTVCDA